MVKKALLVGCNCESSLFLGALSFVCLMKTVSFIDTNSQELEGFQDPGTQAQLNGCGNDVLVMREILAQRYGFPEQNINILLDMDSRYPAPTGKAIKEGLMALIDGAGDGDVCLFHYSGHGTQIPNKKGTEADGLDEAIVPTDMNIMVDDDLKLIVGRCHPGVKFTMVADCCHSGGMLDGTEVIISGDKSGVPNLGGILSAAFAKRDFSPEELEINNKELPLSMLCSILQQQTGQATSPSNIHSVLGNAFGSDSSVLVGKITGILTQFQGAQSAGGGGGGGFLSILIGLLKACASKPQTQEGPMGGVPGVPPPADPNRPPDRTVLITGCQSFETSADACPSGDKSKAFGALTNAIQTMIRESPQPLTNRALVTAVREYLSKGQFAQNPCLECSHNVADNPFIC